MGRGGCPETRCRAINEHKSIIEHSVEWSFESWIFVQGTVERTPSQGWASLDPARMVTPGKAFTAYSDVISISGLSVPSQATRPMMMTATESSSIMLRRKALMATV